MDANQLNFSAGPGALPAMVLEQVQEAVRVAPGAGLSILGISHRSPWFADVVAEVETRVRRLLGLPERYHVLLLQGGATQQFSMLPMLLLRGRQTPADYLLTGYWSGKSVPEARREGKVRLLWDGSPEQFRRLPDDRELQFADDAAFFHYVSNETVEGLQFHRTLGLDTVPRICDMSSDFLSRPIQAERFQCIYAHAQKNLGPAGVTLVILDDQLLTAKPADPSLPGFLDYREHVRTHSIYNTPPVFAIYVTLLVLRWLEDSIGGLGAMAAINQRKAATLYAVLDQYPDVFMGRARVQDRSLMNVVFTMPSPELEQQFLHEAASAGFSGLGGHRAIGGLRASIYNGLEQAACDRLAAFMTDFAAKRR